MGQPEIALSTREMSSASINERAAYDSMYTIAPYTIATSEHSDYPLSLFGVFYTPI